MDRQVSQVNYAALIPVKSLQQAKSRLSDHLTQTQRASLMLDMVGHVLMVLRCSEMFTRISVVSSDSRVLEFARARGAHARVEERAGHNPALTAAAARELHEGTDGLLTISADLPLLCPDDIRGMIAQAQYSEVVLASSREGTGTNALLASPPLVIPYLFGPGSLQRHQAAAQQRQLRCSIYTRLGLALDIDTIDDIHTFHQYNFSCQSACASGCL